MLVVMVLGAVQIYNDWNEYNTLSGYLSQLKIENAELTKLYHASYDLEDIRTKALALGMIPKEEAQTMALTVTLPTPEPEVSRIDEIKWFLEGLFA